MTNPLAAMKDGERGTANATWIVLQWMASIEALRGRRPLRRGLSIVTDSQLNAAREAAAREDERNG